eukprot:scaffold26430_cov75-Phaeocystis_antarctica.AAC.1
MGPGWQRVSKKRPSPSVGRMGSNGSRQTNGFQTDHTFIAPDGRRFTSRVKAVRYFSPSLSPSRSSSSSSSSSSNPDPNPKPNPNRRCATPAPTAAAWTAATTRAATLQQSSTRRGMRPPPPRNVTRYPTARMRCLISSQSATSGRGG